MADFKISPEDFLSSAQAVKTSAQRMMTGASTAAQQGWNQLKATPANVGTVKDALRTSVGVDIQPPDAWDLGAAYRSAKSTLTGLWRGYVAPYLR